MPALEIAKYVIEEALTKGFPVSNLKLQKMLYFIQGVMLIEYEERAFDEKIEAWQYGPVVPDVYFAYSSYGASPILLRYPDIDLNVRVQVAANVVIDSFLKKSAFALVNETHKEGSPWDKAYHSGDKEIRIADIREYFSDHYVVREG